MKFRIDKQRPAGREGMTLVELMIAVTVFGILMGVVMGFLVESRRSYTDTRERALYQQSMRATISLIASEVRSAGCDPTDNGFDSFAVAGDAALQCRMDLNGDADFTDTGPDESISYVFNPGTGELSRDSGAGAQVILRNLTGLSFIYFDQNGAQLNNTPLNALDRAQIRFVEIRIQGESNHNEPLEYSSRVAVRNI